MISDDPVEIAEKLSEAQRRYLLNGRCGVPRDHEEWSADCICGNEHIALAFIRDGIAHRRERYPGGIVLTPLGEAVRSHLKDQQQ